VPITPGKALLELILLVAVVDAIFVAAYFLAGIRTASDAVKLVFTVVWTALTLAIVIWGLSRFRKARLQQSGSIRN
jgi:heme/copper-type cytochrome/quinol oxidase subunit 4